MLIDEFMVEDEDSKEFLEKRTGVRDGRYSITLSLISDSNCNGVT